eukprot:07151.XXX_199929_200051_1 [CDS] Oithona nana genome sequencing.
MENSVRYKIDVNARTALGETSFIYACDFGNEDIVRVLLDNS